MSGSSRDEATGKQTTGHEWDGIKELDTPLPRWWIWTFYVSILWSIGYWLLMPAWPTLVGDGFTKGLLGYSQRDVVAAEVAASDLTLAEPRARIAASSLSGIENDPDLFAVALATGRSAFGDNCAPCHGSGAQGAVGFPNLNDDDWLWGGHREEIATTIRHGIRAENDPDTRLSAMPRFLADALLDPRSVADAAEFVLSLSGGSDDPAAVARGGAVFAEQCSLCHGETGTGDQTQGAPNLSDAIWLYGGDRVSVHDSIANAHYGIMPAWAGRLTEAEIKSLALYVYHLGGGTPDSEAP